MHARSLLILFGLLSSTASAWEYPWKLEDADNRKDHCSRALPALEPWFVNLAATMKDGKIEFDQQKIRTMIGVANGHPEITLYKPNPVIARDGDKVTLEIGFHENFKKRYPKSGSVAFKITGTMKNGKLATYEVLGYGTENEVREKETLTFADKNGTCYPVSKTHVGRSTRFPDFDLAVCRKNAAAAGCNWYLPKELIADKQLSPGGPAAAVESAPDTKTGGAQ